ncbi:MAG: hypothetical protein AAFQ22_13555 [Pseudomonadota bacterium]
MTKFTFKQANQRYRRAFAPAMAAYSGMSLAGLAAFNNGLVEGPVALTALATGITAPIIVVFLLMLRFVEETDEFTRLRQLRAIAQGAMVSLSLAFFLGFLQALGVIGEVLALWFVPLFFAAWGIAFYLSGQTNKTGETE